MQWMKHLFFSKKTIEHHTILLIKAAQDGHVDDVQRLIPLANPKHDDSRALLWAAMNGQAQCVELLIPVSNPKANNSAALRYAAKNGHTQCVALLISVSNPKTKNSMALRGAVYHGHASCVALLYPVSDPIVALNVLQHEFPNVPEKWIILEQQIDADRLNTLLIKEVGNVTDHTIGTKVQRKM